VPPPEAAESTATGTPAAAAGSQISAAWGDFQRDARGAPVGPIPALCSR